MIVNKVAFEVDLNDRESMRKIMSSTLGTKFIGRFGSTMCDLALDAVSKVGIFGVSISCMHNLDVPKGG